MPGEEALIIEGIRELAKYVVDFNYHSIGGECPNCHHGPVYERHVGAPILGHTQPLVSLQAGAPTQPKSSLWVRMD